MSIRIGIDSGGTFTDAVLVTEAGQIKITKTPSTPNDPSEGVYNALMKIIKQGGYSCDDVSTLIHGTTVATNALLEYKGVKSGLLLTKGFKDVLSIIRQDRPKMYDFFERRPPPLVPRQLRIEFVESIGAIFRKEKVNCKYKCKFYPAHTPKSSGLRTPLPPRLRTCV